jgi:hypothetical protein
MAFLELDILTFLRLLVIGNLVAMVMVFAYRSPGNHAAPIRFFVLARLCQSMAFLLISLRGQIRCGSPRMWATLPARRLRLRDPRPRAPV